MENIFLDTYNNMVTKEWTKNGITLQMSWNSENRMTESTVLNASTGGKSITRYKYDHEGNRVLKSGRYGEVVTPTPEISYRNDTIVTKHIFVSGVRVASKVCDEKSSNTYYQSVDHLGSTNLLTDAKGNFYEYIETFPDGEIWVKEYVNQSGVTTIFTSYTKDLETMLFVAGKRYYDAQLGRFTSVDPILGSYLNGAPNFGVYLKQNLNLYSYCYNSPVNYVDPTGEHPGIVAGAVAGGAIGAVAGGISYAMNDKPFSWKDLGGSITGGAVSGAGTGALIGSGVGIIPLLAGAFASGATGSAVENLVHNFDKDIDFTNLATDAAIDGGINAVTAGTVKGASKIISKVIDKVATKIVFNKGTVKTLRSLATSEAGNEQFGKMMSSAIKNKVYTKVLMQNMNDVIFGTIVDKAQDESGSNVVKSDNLNYSEPHFIGDQKLVIPE